MCGVLGREDAMKFEIYEKEQLRAWSAGECRGVVAGERCGRLGLNL